MIYLKTFCCFWDMQIGSIVVGYATGALSAVCCVGSVLRLILELPVIMQNDDYQGEFQFNPLFFVFTAMFFACHTITSFALVPAAKQGQGIFIVPTIVMLFVDIILDCTALIVLGMKLARYNSEKFLLPGIITALVFLPILVYSTVTVLSYFEELFKTAEQVPLNKKKTRKIPVLPPPAESSDNSNASIGTVV